MQDKKFTEIFNQYKPLVYNVALHYVLYTADAEDVLQDVFVKVYKQLHFFNEAEASLKTWIYKITINTCLDYLKAKKTKKRLGVLVSIFNIHTVNKQVAVNNFHPGVAMEQKEETEKVLLAIQQLPPQQQTAIILTKIENRPQKEVAEIMKTSIKAVEGLLIRAKQNLHKKLNSN